MQVNLYNNFAGQANKNSMTEVYLVYFLLYFLILFFCRTAKKNLISYFSRSNVKKTAFKLNPMMIFQVQQAALK
jgi:hypothetical protein